MRTLRQAIETRDRVIIHHSLRRGWTADAPEGATYGDLVWHPTLEAALGGNIALTDEEQGKLEAAMLMMPVNAVVPDGWPAGDPYIPPPPQGCDYMLSWEWWPGQQYTLNGWLRGLPLW